MEVLSSLLTQDKLTLSFRSACDPHVLPSVSSISAVQPGHLSHACRARPFSTAPSWWWFVSFIPSFLRFMQPFPFSFLGLSALHAMIALFYLSLFSLYHAKRYWYLLFRPVSTSPFLLIPGFLSSYHLRELVWLLTWPLCFSSSCLSLGEKTLQFACQALAWARWEGDIAEAEYIHVAVFATGITVNPMYLLLFFWSPKLILSTDTQKHLHALEGLSSERWTCPKTSTGHHQLWCRWAEVRDGSSSPTSGIVTHRPTATRKTCRGLVTTASNISPFLQTVLAKPPEKWDMFITASYWMFTAHSAAKR